MIKRKRRSSKDAMDFIELSRDATKLLRDAQCLQQSVGSWVEVKCGGDGVNSEHTAYMYEPHLPHLQNWSHL